jgi:hypothetical protein
MFYVRKPEPPRALLIREATAEELHNFKNKFNRVSSEEECPQKPQGNPNESLTNDLIFINCELGF